MFPLKVHLFTVAFRIELCYSGVKITFLILYRYVFHKSQSQKVKLIP